VGGSCEQGACFIGGAPYANGELNPANPCQHCSNAAPTQWTNVMTGTPCGAGQICFTGSCLAACNIQYPNGATTVPTVFPAGAMDPYHGCYACLPAVSTTSWSPAPDGTPCGSAGGTCTAGSCSAGAPTNPSSSCVVGSDCASGYCLNYLPAGPVQCYSFCGQPGDACHANGDNGLCCNGLGCHTDPVTGQGICE